MLVAERRAPKNEPTGTAGESETMADFERLGWGVAINSRHDTGTDLILWPRDERRYDLDVFVGAQVKSGPSQFEEPKLSRDGKLEGWWFRDDEREYVDFWAEHGSAHFILLHDLEARKTYWQHVTKLVIESTGMGAKILVPVGNTVDEAHRAELQTLSVAKRSAISWEGSVWTGAPHLAPEDRLRHALVVPRLVAPHGNVGFGTAIDPEQAVALLVQARVMDLSRFAEHHATVPKLDEAEGSEEWPWKFVGALGQYVLQNTVAELLNRVDDATTSTQRVGACVVAVSALVAHERVDEALRLVEQVLAHDDASPIDHAWLQLQWARLCLEVGRVDDARGAAFDVQAIRMVKPEDVTASALAGYATEILFLTAEWRAENLAQLVANRDNAASWWRTQTMATGLGAFQERTYKTWARDRSTTFSSSDVANNELFSAACSANFLGDHSSWRHLFGLLGEDGLVRLDRRSDPADAAAGLARLRLAGDVGDLELAVSRFCSNGPALAVRQSAAEVDMEVATRTTAQPGIRLFTRGGDVVDEATADRAITWAIRTLSGQDMFTGRTRPTYMVSLDLADLISSLVLSASEESQKAVVIHLVNLGSETNELLSRCWARILGDLPHDTWTTEDIRKLRESENLQLHYHHLAILGVASRNNDESARAILLGQAREGSIDALGALGDVRTLQADVVAGLLAAFQDRIKSILESAAGGSWGAFGPDFGRAATLLNVWHPDVADWDPVIDLLQSRVVLADEKTGALGILAAMPEKIPADIGAKILKLFETGTLESGTVDPIFGIGTDIRGAAAEVGAALKIMDDDASAAYILDLLSGGAVQRQWAAQVARRLNRPEDAGVLVALIHDDEPDVRAVAGMGLASLLVKGEKSPAILEGVRRSLTDTGTVVPLLVARVLAEFKFDSDVIGLLATLEDHISARVRKAIRGDH
jgi:hypothetical protein